MKIAIISDTHDNIPNIKKVLDYCLKNNIKKIIHCGDLAEMETLNYIKENFSGDFFWSFGNMDTDHFSILTSKNLNDLGYEKFHIYKNAGEIEIENKAITFVHFPDKAKKLCESSKYDFVFYGHTHKPWIESIKTNQKKCTLLNPGNVSNSIYPPTFAIWNTENDNFDLIRINKL